MKLLVTGGAGFIGKTLVSLLLKEGHEVSVLDNFSTGRRENIPHEVECFEGDAADQLMVEKALAGVDGVFHLAAIPSVIISENVPLINQHSGEVSLLSVLAASLRSKSVKRIVYASSAAVYGDCPNLPVNEAAQLKPLSNYAVSKLAGELYLRAACFRQDRLDTVSLRFFNVYGPGQQPDSSYAGVITKFVKYIAEKTPPLIYGDGNQKRDFIWVEDVVRACLLAMISTKRFSGRPINIASGLESSVLSVWDALSKATQSTLEPEFRAARCGEIRDSLADCSLAEALLGFKAETNLDDGINLLISGKNNYS